MKLKRFSQVIALLLFMTLPLMLLAQDEDPTPSPDTEATAEVTPPAEMTPEVEETCPAIVERAIQLTRTGCTNVGNNDVCYGHLLLDAVLRGSAAENTFESPGDVIDVIEVENLSLSALDTLRGIWGVVLLQVDATFDDINNDDQVTYVVFGDAELQSANQLILVSTLADSSIRETPDTTASVLTRVDAETIIVASGITEDGEWLRIRLQSTEDNEDTRTGWLATELVELAESDGLTFDDLPVISPEDEETSDRPEFGPMQAFYFESGRDDSPCPEAPESGVLIQTPEGQASVSVWIDEVIVELNATAFVQANAGGDITINVLDGAARVTANGQTREVPEGSAVIVPLDEELGAAGVPSAPVPIDLDDLNALPLTLLPEQPQVAEPITIGVPVTGSWLWTWGADSLTCDDAANTEVAFEGSGVPSELSVSPDGTTITYGGSQYGLASAGVYTNNYIDNNGNLHQDTLTVVSTDRISGLKVVDYAAIVCTLEVPFSLTLSR